MNGFIDHLKDVFRLFGLVVRDTLHLKAHAVRLPDTVFPADNVSAYRTLLDKTFDISDCVLDAGVRPA